MKEATLEKNLNDWLERLHPHLTETAYLEAGRYLAEGDLYGATMFLTLLEDNISDDYNEVKERLEHGA